MPKNVDDIIKQLSPSSPSRRKKVEKRATQLAAEEMTRQELRRVRERTQVDVAKHWALPRMAFRALNSEAILCFRHCGIVSRP